MRIRLRVGTAAILLATAGLARAQQPAAADVATAPAPRGVTGSIDVGARGGSVSGDAARYERYRDLRRGVFSRVVFGKDTDERMFSAQAENIGYRDQRYLLDYAGGRLRGNASWDSIPLNYSYLTATPWVQAATGVFSLDAAARTAVQNRVAGIVGVPASAAQLGTASIFRGLSRSFDLQSRRDVVSARVDADATDAFGWNLSFTSTKKSGQQPYGLSFAFNNANELAIPLDNRTNDVSAGLAWTSDRGMVRVGWDASWFDNRIHEIIWDNPLRVTDTNPIDPSGYSNGNGSARGRMSMPPSNTLNTITTTGLYKMPAHTTINGTVSFTAMNQNDALIPWTINPVIANSSVYATFPALASLPRQTAEAKVHGLNAMVNLTSRPNRLFGLSTRYRFNDHRNLTPAFDAVEYVRFDAVPEETGSETQQFNIREHTFDVTGTFNLMPATALRVGYTFDDFNRTGRAFSDMTDHTLRASLDRTGNQYVMVRVSVEHTARLGRGFSEASIEEGGAQPGLRFYDEADRDRNRGTVLVTIMPMDSVDVSVSATAGKDVYKGEGHEFGLLNNTNATYNAGINVSPWKTVSFGANYGRETFNSLQRSANANPPGSDYGSWTDPNRVWTLTNDERVNTVDVYLDLLKAVKKTDIRMGYTYSDSNNAFIHGGPRVQELSTNTFLTAGDAPPCAAGVTSCFEALPPVTNAWHRLSVDVKYFFTSAVGIGVGYWYERLDVSDYATIDLPGAAGTPRIDYLGEIGTGYGNRPYRGSTGFVRLLYVF